MFEISGETEIKEIRLKNEAHDDELKRALYVKVAIADTPANKLDSAIPQLLEKFFSGKEPQLQEIFPLKPAHHITNCVAVFSAGKPAKRVKLDGCDISKISITPRFGGHAELQLTLKFVPAQDGQADQLWKWLKGIVKLTIKEKQLDLPAMDQKKEASG